MVAIVIPFIAATAAPNDLIVVSYTNISAIIPTTRSGKQYGVIRVNAPIGNWKDKRPEGDIVTQPRLRLTFPSGMKTFEFCPGTWSSYGNTIRVLLGGTNTRARAMLMQQWTNANPSLQGSSHLEAQRSVAR